MRRLLGLLVFGGFLVACSQDAQGPPALPPPAPSSVAPAPPPPQSPPADTTQTIAPPPPQSPPADTTQTIAPSTPGSPGSPPGDSRTGSPPKPTVDTPPPPPVVIEPAQCSDRNGLWLPSSHTLRTLVLFIRHRDENHHSSWWPADGFPSDWQQIIDSTLTQDTKLQYNLTHFYREASANAQVPFTLIGRVDTVTADLPVLHERTFGQANRQVLQQVEGRYDAELGDWLDNWTRREFCHEQSSDGNIDLIIMVWRSNRFQGGGLFWSGIAMIGEADTPAYRFLNKQILLPNHTRFASSGVTVALRERSVRDRLLTQDAVFKTIVHEIAHNQVSYSHPQGGSVGMQRFPSMLTYSEQQIHTHNGREAAQLGWGRLTEITSDTTISLGDFYETGESVWIRTSRFHYLVENRQKTSIYDDASQNPDDKGLFVYRYSQVRPGRISYDSRNTSITPLPADGFFDWTFTGRWLPGWLAIFERGEANARDGSGFTRRQPTGGGNHHWISAIERGVGRTQGVGEQEAGDPAPDTPDTPVMSGTPGTPGMPDTPGAGVGSAMGNQRDNGTANDTGSLGDFRGNGLFASFNLDRPLLSPDTNPATDDLRLRVVGQQGNVLRFSVQILP